MRTLKTTLASLGMLSLVECLSTGNQTKDAEDALVSSPYVEAYLEFSGPDAKWAGPMSANLHVDAREAMPKVTFSPALKPPAAAEVMDRTLASEKLGEKPSDKDVEKAEKSGPTAQQVRESLTELALEIEAQDREAEGCLYPVRARMIRADGSVLESSACRGHPYGVSWAGSASVFFAKMMGGDE